MLSIQSSCCPCKVGGQIMGPCMEGTDRDWVIYKIMSQDMSTITSYWVEQFGVSILNQGSKVREVWWQVSSSTHPGEYIGTPGDDGSHRRRIPTRRTMAYIGEIMLTRWNIRNNYVSRECNLEVNFPVTFHEWQCSGKRQINPLSNIRDILGIRPHTHQTVLVSQEIALVFNRPDGLL